MFCNQCKQKNSGVACTVNGVCGKDSEKAASQDALTEIIKGVVVWEVAACVAKATKEDMKRATSGLFNLPFPL